ncbi:MAG: amino acid ABC transporter substrate-binding protein [Firmicutes bacterium]|jgi:polar amino acid transport system substrate-binding protein|nr:amino acid ABC transporter substrate-binding protein [Bacillota bacterium]
MKKLGILLLVVVMAVVGLTGCGSAKEDKGDVSLETIKEKGEVVIGLDDSFPPMGYVDENGELVGFDIDLAKEACSRLGVEAVFKPTEWDGIVLALNNGEIDVVWNGMTITEERLEKIAFSKPYIANTQSVIVKKGSDVKTLKDLEGKIVGTQLESSGALAVRNNEEVSASIKELKEYSNNVEALMDLEIGRVDAVVVDEILGRYYIQQNDKDFEVLAEDLGAENYGVGIRKEDVSFREALDKVLDEMKEDGTAKEISEKWFQEDIMLR